MSAILVPLMTAAFKVASDSLLEAIARAEASTWSRELDGVVLSGQT